MNDYKWFLIGFVVVFFGFCAAVAWGLSLAALPHN
jgi:hypothetical protein